jgi:hypothetical protein
VHRSSDAEDSYELVGSIEGALLETLEHAPSLPSRVYLAGATAPPSRPAVYRSDDGGQTITETPFAWPSDVERLYVAAVDPSNHDVVYLGGSLAPSSGKSTAIFRSTDGGTSYEELLRTTGPALGFAVSSDGTTVWVGSTTEGLLRSSDGGYGCLLVGSRVDARSRGVVVAALLGSVAMARRRRRARPWRRAPQLPPTSSSISALA